MNNDAEESQSNINDWARHCIFKYAILCIHNRKYAHINSNSVATCFFMM